MSVFLSTVSNIIASGCDEIFSLLELILRSALFFCLCTCVSVPVPGEECKERSNWTVFDFCLSGIDRVCC